MKWTQHSLFRGENGLLHLSAEVTRKHSSRMSTSRLHGPYLLLQLPLDVSYGWGPQVNKFQQVSRLDHQMSVAGDQGVLMSHVWMRGGVVTGPRLGQGLCTVRSNASCVMVTWEPRLPPVNRQTDKTENITFPQLRWRAVDSYQNPNYNSRHSYPLHCSRVFNECSFQSSKWNCILSSRRYEAN